MALRGSGLSWDQISRHLPGRTATSVRAQWRTRNSALDALWSQRSSSVWSVRDIELLHDLKRKGLRGRDLAPHFPGRTIKAIRTRWNIERLKDPALAGYDEEVLWTKDEVESAVKLRKEGLCFAAISPLLPKWRSPMAAKHALSQRGVRSPKAKKDQTAGAARPKKQTKGVSKTSEKSDGATLSTEMPSNATNADP